MWGKKNKADEKFKAAIKTEELEQRQEQIKLMNEVELLRDQIPVGVKVVILNKEMLVDRVYSNYPAPGFEVKLVYFSDITGVFEIVKLPLKMVEDSIKEAG